MADITKEELRTEITAILKDADLTTMSAKKVRQQLETKLDCELTKRKKEIDELVMEFVNSRDKSNGESEGESDEDSEEEEVSEEEDVSEEEVKPKTKAVKRGPPKKAAAPAKKAKKVAVSEESGSDNSGDASEEEYSPIKAKPKPRGRKAGSKKKKGSASDSDEDWNKSKRKSSKKGGGSARGYTQPYKLSPELAALVGSEIMPRHEVVKKIWEIIKERNLYDPINKQFAICDAELMTVIGIKRFRTFGMMKYLKTHFIEKF